MGIDNKFWRGKRIFLTGHTGFKGGWLAVWLDMLGAKVYGYALKPNTSPNFFNAIGLKNIVNSTIGDIRDYKKLSASIKKARPDIVFHLAAQPLVRLSYKEPLETYQTNILGTANLLHAIRNIESIRSVIVITSDKCYENKEINYAYKEIDSLGGHDPYSSSKACAEIVTAAFRKSFFVDSNTVIASARAGNVIGGGDWAADRLVPDCIRSWQAGKIVEIRYPNAIRPWQHVLEPLGGYIQLAEKLFKKGNVFAEAWNFGPDKGNAKNVAFLVDTLSKLWGTNAKWKKTIIKHPHEAILLKLDYSKAKKQLSWKPCWNIATSLEKTVHWYKSYLNNQKKSAAITIEQISQYMKDSK